MNNIALLLLAVFITYIVVVTLITLQISSRERRRQINATTPPPPHELKLELKTVTNPETGQVRVETIIQNPVRDERYTYAFYLIVDGVRTTVRWHEETPFFVIPRPSANKKTEVLAFAKSESGSLATLRQIL
ncbi:hypothetical protein [Advenella mimigardefordensis]|uniref:hypothetical protein n=1 Tax=Advenella mimigardefordensis TaxID=302406 RepID=UPI00130E5160|nr:hypothetical protein [Advenella mimigardefordensis]